MTQAEVLAQIDSTANPIIQSINEGIQKAAQVGSIAGVHGNQASLQGYQDRVAQLKQMVNSGSIPLDAWNPNLIQNFISGSPTGMQAINEAAAASSQLAKQNQQLQDFRNQFERQEFGGQGLSLNQALTSTGGDIGNLNQFLGQQEASTFNTQLKPLIQMALGSQGLSDSGANVELQSKALAQLEQARQQNMMQAALGARSQLQGIQRSDVLGNIGYSQQSLTNQADLARMGISMQFQQQLEQQREQLTRDLMSRQGGGGMGLLGQVLGGVGAAGSIIGAPFTGGASLGLLPMSLGMAMGGGYQGGMMGAAAAPAFQSAGQGFFRQTTPTARTPQQQTQSPYGPYAGGYQYPPQYGQQF